MGGSVTQKLWDEIFSQHQKVLSKHLEFLTLAQNHSGDGSNGSEILQTCLAQTETMTKVFNKAAARFMEQREKDETPAQEPQNSAEPSDTPKSPTTRTPTKIDPSGLFMTDTNPTPIEELLHDHSTSAAIRIKSQNNSKAKRKDSHPDRLADSPSGSAAANQEPRRKKARIEYQTENAEKVEPNSPRISEAGDSFAREVEAKMNAKEERRLKKADKKRKRESGDSMPDGAPNGNNSTSKSPKTSKPNKKKFKRASGGNHGAEGVNGAEKSNARPPKNEKYKMKRARSGARGPAKKQKNTA